MAKRKSNGEGSITYQTDRKKYYARIIDNTGKRISKRFDTKKEAQEWLACIRTDIVRDEYIPPNSITVLEWVLEFLDTYKKNNVRIRTLQRYMQAVNQLKGLGNLKLQDLTAAHVQKLLNKLGKTYSSSSVIKVHNVLTAACKKALVLGMINRNPMDAVEKPSLKTAEIEIFTDEELKRLESFSAEYLSGKYHCIVYMAITTGMRLGEILGLKVSSVHKGYIEVNNSLQELNGKLYDEKPKTKAGERKVYITEKLQALLYQEIRGRKLMSVDGYVFLTKNGTPYHVRNFNTAWLRLLNNAGIERKHFHALRHTHATKLLAAGVPILEVSARLGHSKASHTLDLYGHTIKNYQEEMVEKVQSTFNF